LWKKRVKQSLGVSVGGKKKARDCMKRGEMKKGNLSEVRDPVLIPNQWKNEGGDKSREKGVKKGNKKTSLALVSKFRVKKKKRGKLSREKLVHTQNPERASWVVQWGGGVEIEGQTEGVQYRKGSPKDLC